MDKLAEQIASIAANAVEMCSARDDGGLDFSEASLSIVEEMVAEASDFLDSMTPDQQDALAQDFGCYILEVARREFGGRSHGSINGTNRSWWSGSPSSRLHS